ncbi:MAG: carboxypeptidase-like regulatory domain-containing protein [Paludibacteraceae bacterium]|nr:carboxypeptidase-like regulatory domain-containing protein [Paludibacteraceae bacterium]
MRRIAYIIYIMCLLTSSLKAEVITGTVVEQSGEPIPYASVFQKALPLQGVSTDIDGKFSIDLDRSSDDVLIISFISYKTVEHPISKISTGANLKITLLEQPIMLDEAVVQVKLSRREARQIKKNVLTQFRERLVKDFPKRKNDFNIVSSYSGSQNGRKLMQHEVVGVMHEVPAKHGDFSDSLRLEILDVRKFYTDEVKKGFVLLDSMAAERADTKKAKRRGAHYHSTTLDSRAESMHRFLWGGQSCYIVDRVDFDKASRWQYTEIDGKTVLIYKRTWNILIAKAEMKVYFYVNPSTFALLKMTQCVDFEIHIPFGYKLSSDELELLNTLQLPDETMKKLRVRHLYGNVKRNVIFSSDGSPKRSVKEKNLAVDVRVVGSKKETLDYKANAKAVVTQ